jgi:hypothetical protein
VYLFLSQCLSVFSLMLTWLDNILVLLDTHLMKCRQSRVLVLGTVLWVGMLMLGLHAYDCSGVWKAIPMVLGWITTRYTRFVIFGVDRGFHTHFRIVRAKYHTSWYVIERYFSDYVTAPPGLCTRLIYIPNPDTLTHSTKLHQLVQVSSTT